MENKETKMMRDLIDLLDSIAFEEGPSDDAKLNSIQGLLYQYSQIMDARSISMEEQHLEEGFRR